MSDAPKDIYKKLNRKDTKKQLLALLNLFDITIMEPKVKANKSNNSVDSIQELIDYIRVSIKYKLFDNESLNREIKILKKICKDNNIDLR